MKQDTCFWEARPFTEEMVSYASQDVQHLPRIYELLKNVEGVYQQSEKYRLYPYINNGHPGLHFATPGTYIAAFI